LTQQAIRLKFFRFIELAMANYSFALWIALSVGLLLLFLYAALLNLRRQHQGKVDVDEILPYLLPVNLQALAEALDPSQDDYLRHSHSPREFRKLQRKRTKLAAEYLRRMSHNAALLQRVGYSQLRSPNRMVAEQAQELIDVGVNVRLYAFLGLAGLFFRRFWVLRSMSFARIAKLQKMMSASLVPAYQALRSKAEEITMLRASGVHEALSQGF
jgi:hypothetical protein